MEPNQHPASAPRAVDLDIRVTTPWGRGGQRLDFVVHSPSGALDYHHEPVPGRTLKSPDSFQRQIVEQLEALHHGHDVEDGKILRGEVLQELETIGHDLYQQLFPPQMKSIYREVAGKVRTLLITSDEPWIPWEIVRPFESDDDDFFCMRFQMARWLTGTVALAFEPTVRKILYIESGADGQLAGGATEWRALTSLAEHYSGLQAAPRRGVDFQTAIGLLESEPFDLLHLSAHGRHDADRPAEAKVVLADRSLRARHLSPAAEKKLRAARPIVLFNSCQVGQLGRSLVDLDGWAERWVRRCGCSAFLAPTWSVRDSRAARFAELFYGHLAAGRTLGEAVLTSRTTLRNEEPGDLAWLAYSLYGAPTARVGFGGVAAQDPERLQPRPPVAPTMKPRPPEPSEQTSIQAPRPVAGTPTPGRPAALSPGNALWTRHRHTLAIAVALAVVLVAWIWISSALKRPDTAEQGGIASHTENPQQPTGTGGEVEPFKEGSLPLQPAATEPKPSPDGANQSSSSERNLASEPEPPPPKTQAAPTPSLPLQPLQPGKIAVLVLNRTSGAVDRSVADAISAALASLGPSLNAITPQAPAAEINKLLEGDYSAIPSGGDVPWGAEYLLVVQSTVNPLPQSTTNTEAVSLFLDSRLISTRNQSLEKRHTDTQQGRDIAGGGALVLAAERCIRPIYVALQGDS